MIRLFDQAEVIRSKNSGPYELTFDIIFKEAEHFKAFAAANVMTPAVFAKLYNIPESDVLSVIAFPPAKAVKITIIRPMASGALGEKDIYGAQQHGLLLNFEYSL
ncbi:MAG: DUF4387 domain-containing protein [Clostridiales bacterium]|jgi:hypothetical protein|nr:DUF4387 domain-containing protein [Clostridiales bacterium]